MILTKGKTIMEKKYKVLSDYDLQGHDFNEMYETKEEAIEAATNKIQENPHCANKYIAQIMIEVKPATKPVIEVEVTEL